MFDCLGGNAVISRCFRSELLRRAGWRLLGWLEEVLVEADTAAQVRGEEVASGEYREGEDDECRSQEYKIGDDVCHGSHTLDAHPSQPDSGWGDPQW